MKFLKFVIWTLISANIVAAYRTDIDDSGDAAFCEHRKHFTFKPTATCCANQVIKPALDVSTLIEKCRENGKSKTTVEDIGWEIYSCMLRMASESESKTELTLQQFADLITTNYPEDIKSKINTEIGSQTIPPASLTNYGRLEKLRVTYYDIEKEVCEGMPSETKSYGNIEMCSSWKEENHRAGMCCRTAYPIDFRYLTMFDLESSSEKATKCRNLIHNDLVGLNVTEMMEHSLVDICALACEMHAKKIIDIHRSITHNREYWHFNVTNLLNTPKFIPDFLNENTIQEAKDFLVSNFILNNTVEAIQNFEFGDVIGGNSFTERSSHEIAYVHRGNYSTGENFKSEFMGRRFHKGILHVPILCSIHQELITRLEHYIFRDCKPEDVTETPAPAPPPEEETKPEPEQTAQPETTDASAAPPEASTSSEGA